MSGNNLSAQAIAEIRSIPGLIKREIEHAMRGRTRNTTASERQVRVARTVAFNHPYPTGPATQYEVAFGKPEFDDTTVGLIEVLDFTPYSADAGDVRVARLLEKETIKEGTQVHVRLVHGQWYITRGKPEATGATLVQLEGNAYGADDETCGGREEVDASNGLTVKIVRRPCGAATVFGEVDGYLEVFDLMGWLAGQSPANINGAMAFVHLTENEYGECEWVLGIPNLFQERQFVQDWYISGLDIIEEKVNARVFGWCQLPNEITIGVNCTTAYGYGS